MGPHQGSVEGQENLPHPAAHTPLDAPQDPIGLLGSICFAGASLPSNPSLPSPGKSVSEVARETFLSARLRRPPCIPRARSSEEKWTSRLPKQGRSRCPWPLSVRVCGSGFQSYSGWRAWGQSRGRRASGSCLYSGHFWKCIMKSERNGATLEGRELLELRLPGADRRVKTGELPGRSFGTVLAVNEKSTPSWRTACLPVGLARLKIIPSFTNQKWTLGSPERFCSDNAVFNEVDVMASYLSRGFSFQDSDETAI